jgi:hypothetical protein
VNQAAAAAGDPAFGVQDEHGGSAPHIQQPDQVEPVRGVEFDVGDPVCPAGHVTQDHSGRAAGSTESGRELQEGGPLAERAAELLGGDPGTAIVALSSAGATGSAKPAVAAPADKPEGGGSAEHENASENAS